jgi:PAS domain S-box-containing protein
VGAGIKATSSETKTARPPGAGEARLHDLVHLSPVGIVVSRGGHLELANRAAVELFGAATEAELLGKSPFELFHPDDHELIRERTARLLAGERYAPHVVRRVLGCDGQVRFADVAASTFEDERGCAIQVVLTDVTERVRAEQALRRFELMGSEIRDVVLFVRREDGRLLEANAAALATYGYDRAELLSLSIHQLRAPGTLALTEGQMAAAEAKGILFETVHRRKDGSTFPVEVSSRGAVVDGVRMLLSVVRDITDRRRAEEALRRSQAELLATVEGLSEGVITSTADGQLVHWNRAALEMHGFAAVEEVRRRLAEFESIYTLATPEGRVLSLDEWPLSRLLRGEAVHDLELVLSRRADGWARVFSYGGALVRSSDGRPMAILTVRDVTERRRAVAQLAAERDRLAVTLGSIGDAVIATDADGRITAFNGVAEALTRWTAADAMGRPVHEVFRVVHEETLEPAPSPIERALRDGVVVGLANHTALVARDGTRLPIADSAAPIRGADRRIAGVVLVFRDQTDERRKEQALRSSEARLRLLAEALPQLVWTADGTGRLDWFNERWRDYTGQLPGEEAWEPALHQDDRARVIALWGEAVAGQRELVLEHRLRAADGSFRWFLRRAFPLRDPQGDTWRWFGTCTDIHDLKVSHEVLRQADRLKEDFLSMASHEFRTPLTALRLQSDLLRDALRKLHGPHERTDRQLGVIEKQIDRLEKLVSVLFDASRIAEGKLKLELSETDLAEVARDAVERLGVEAAQAGVEVRLDLQPVTGRWDRTRLEQVVTNLVSNAIKYGERRPVDVTVRPGEGRAELAVRDRGIGIPVASHGVIFERFQRAENAGPVKGLGLGLWIAKSMVTAHGGELRVESAPGEGATFTVSLPRP